MYVFICTQPPAPGVLQPTLDVPDLAQELLREDFNV